MSLRTFSVHVEPNYCPNHVQKATSVRSQHAISVGLKATEVATSIIDYQVCTLFVGCSEPSRVCLSSADNLGVDLSFNLALPHFASGY